MKKINTFLYELTPEEVVNLPKGFQVLRMDVLTHLFKFIRGGEIPSEVRFIKFFIFDLPENVIELKLGKQRAGQ